jgi:multiple sugar transport system ATP-binding protein
MAGLSIRGVEKKFGAVHAVRGIDLDIAPGEFAVLVGPSGCGKTTLLRTIAGLEEVTAGTIALGGREIHDAEPRDRNIAMVFQNYALYPYLTVFDNIAFPLKARRVPKPEIEARVRRAAGMLDIELLLHRYPRELSGGQRQRVAIGRAVVRQAELFLFDEPLSNLDAQLRDEMRSEIKRLHQELGKTMIYVTHDQIEAMTLADRIVLMHDGLIEQQGTPLDLFERPITRFVAGFLGSPQMNFIPCRAVNEDGTAILRFETGETLPLDPRRVQGFAAKGRDLVLGVRPEHFSPQEMGVSPRPGCAPVTARVEIVQPTGSRTFVQFPFGGTTVTAELPAHKVDRPGTTTELLIDLSRTILIESNSGRVISHAI